MALCVERAVVSAKLPARWQLLLHRWRTGAARRPASDRGADEVSVVAKVREIAPWQSSADLRPGVLLGPSPDGEGCLITARVSLARVERLLADPGMLQLEPAQPLRPLLGDASVELFSLPRLLPTAATSRLGAGAVVGVIDRCCDWQHANFLDPSGRPRTTAYWTQSEAARVDNRIGYGAVWDRGELWLNAETTENRVREAGVEDSHGTQLLDIAAGNGRSGSAPGVAPRADIIYVAMDSSSPGGGRPRCRTAGDTVRLLEGAKFIFDQAGPAPCAIDISLGLNAGPHDQSTLFVQALDALAIAAPNRALVVAAGNNYALDQHASRVVRAGESFDLDWHVPAGGRVRHSLEIWYSGEDRFELELIAPRGQGRCKLSLDENGRMVDDCSGRTKILAAHERCAANGDRVMTVFVERGAPAGVWTARLHSRGGTHRAFHAWLEPEDDVRPAFITGVDSMYTLNSLACGNETLAVGAFDAGRPHLPLAWYTSAGPTRDGRPKPDASAPGHRLWAAKAGARESSLECSGTSLAAAAATGVAALVLAEAAAAGITLTASELRQVLIASCRGNPPLAAWDERYGHGRIDASAAVQQILQFRNNSEATVEI